MSSASFLFCSAKLDPKIFLVRALADSSRVSNIWGSFTCSVETSDSEKSTSKIGSSRGSSRSRDMSSFYGFSRHELVLIILSYNVSQNDAFIGFWFFTLFTVLWSIKWKNVLSLVNLRRMDEKIGTVVAKSLDVTNFKIYHQFDFWTLIGWSSKMVRYYSMLGFSTNFQITF